MRARTARAHGTRRVSSRPAHRRARYLLYGEGAGEHEDSLLLVDSGFVRLGLELG